MRRLRTTTLGSIKIEADDLIVGLIDRIVKTERALAAVRSELNDHMNMIAEMQPKIKPDGTVSLLAMTQNGDQSEEKTVTFTPTGVI